ncbi:unnamed protein product, partial [Sphenostylis stenocarpa]
MRRYYQVTIIPSYSLIQDLKRKRNIGRRKSAQRTLPAPSGFEARRILPALEKSHSTDLQSREGPPRAKIRLTPSEMRPADWT